MDKDTRQSHLDWKEQEMISDLVFQSTGRHVHGLDRVFLPSAKFLSAVGNAGDRLLFYGVVQFTQLAVLAEIWLFDDKVGVVKITAGDVFPSGAKMLFNSVSQIRAGAAGFGVISDIAVVETVEGWRIYGAFGSGVAGDEYHLTQYVDNEDEDTGTAFSGSKDNIELIGVAGGPYLTAASDSQLMAIANFDYSNQRWLSDDMNDLAGLQDLRDLAPIGSSIRLLAASPGGTGKQTGRYWTVALNDESFELLPDAVHFVDGAWDLSVPQNGKFVVGGNYRFRTNKTEGSVKLILVDGSNFDDGVYPDLVVPIVGGNVAFSPIQADIDFAGSAGYHYILSYVPVETTYTILIKNGNSSGTDLVFLHHGYAVNLAFDQVAEVTIYPGEAMTAYYGFFVHARASRFQGVAPGLYDGTPPSVLLSASTAANQPAPAAGVITGIKFNNVADAAPSVW